MAAISAFSCCSSRSDCRWLPLNITAEKRPSRRAARPFYAVRCSRTASARHCTPPDGQKSPASGDYRFADHQQAAIAAPFATGRSVVEAAHRLHLRQLGHQRVATGLAQQQRRLAPVSQQIPGVSRRRVPATITPRSSSSDCTACHRAGSVGGGWHTSEKSCVQPCSPPACSPKPGWAFTATARRLKWRRHSPYPRTGNP